MEKENSRMLLESDSLVSLLSFPKILSPNKLKDLVLLDPLPKMDIDISILKNRNIRNLEEQEVKYGLLIRKSTLKYLPTNVSFYSSNIVEENIATELSYAEPILILHTSTDSEWFYIQSYFYRGWLEKKDVIIVNESSFNEFLNPDKFIVMTEYLIPFNDTFIDMGVKLPLMATHESFYEILAPSIDGVKIERINHGHIGYLPYTKDNILNQSYKFLSVPYRWGGTDNGIDCSLLLVNLFKVFGLKIPRDTKEQEPVLGTKISLKGKTEDEKREILNKLEPPFILFKPGHVMLAITNNSILHAYGDAKKVFISQIEDSCGTNLYPLLTSVSIIQKKD